MKLPKRFALSTLLLAMLLVSLVFGYAQWRKQNLVAEVGRLQQDGASVSLTDNWFWPTTSRQAHIWVTGHNSRHVRELESRLTAIGVEEVIKDFVYLGPELKPLTPFPGNYISGNPFE